MTKKATPNKRAKPTMPPPVIVIHCESPVEERIALLKDYLRAELLLLLFRASEEGHPAPSNETYSCSLDRMDELQLANVVALYRQRQKQREWRKKTVTSLLGILSSWCTRLTRTFHKLTHRRPQ